MENLVPITRLGKFFGGEDFTLDTGMGQEWLEGDMNFTVILYRIDRYRTRVDDVYGESPEQGIQFLAPVEIKGYVPERSVVIPGTYPKQFPAGEYQVPCALIIGKRKPSTDLKTSLNDALREFSVSV